MEIPTFLLKKLYTVGSLKNAGGGAQFALKNRLMDAEVVGLRAVAIDGQPVDLDRVRLEVPDLGILTPAEIDAAHPVPFPLRSTVTIRTLAPELKSGKHEIDIGFEARPFGLLQFKIEDAISEEGKGRTRIPRDDADDYSPKIIARRRALIEQVTGARLQHVAQYSFDPHLVKGNCEHFVGAAQVPLGFAGPFRIHGEHAEGEFLIPLATSEGSLVASYNRGMKVLNLSGGVKATVVSDAMQRAPVFVFPDARAARDFVRWVDASLPEIRKEAEATSSVARLQHIDPYLANHFVYLRFNFSTGDAAGQNMVGRATFAACNWMREHYPTIDAFYLESNFATDKKGSQVNILQTRGKRVTAEATIPRDVLVRYMRAEPRQLAYHYGIANVGAFMSGANNNGCQSANGITAMFIATGQDVANVAESSAAIVYCEVKPDEALYLSLTIPALIVATYGGGTGLATQRECLEALGCYGRGKVNRLAEIVASVALAGEISLASAISSQDWVSAHEKLGRNR
jgi:hydroxymethylglutaryl-CoA reductase (NADPH)